MSKVNLNSICRVSEGSINDSFVGIKMISGIPEIVFPLGYRLGNNDSELRSDILLLVRVLNKFSNTSSDIMLPTKDNGSTNYHFPIFAYYRIIQHFLANGNYSENEVAYHSGYRGKINWAKTISKKTALIQENHAVYLDYIVRGTNNNLDSLIAEIYKYCVHISFQQIGWLFSTLKYPMPKVKFNKILFEATVKKKLDETFNDRSKELLRDMLNVILNNSTGKGDSQFRTVGTNRFEYIWEKLVDSTFGVSDKENYFPRTQWCLINAEGHKVNHSLKPDTIMIQDNDVYILDAKYYRYGCTGETSHLPETASVHKQITYGEYLHTSDKFIFEQIFNAFIMPADLKNGLFRGSDLSQFIGHAHSEWKSNNLSYEKVAGILVDTKSIMQGYLHKNNLMKSVSADISNCVNV
ncbi:LlaJI family restriction endonuclease [Anaerosporobacter sp.]|uniref:LlaJI family restriction endonuclease n=1 Tax=Anaerosporobacter sp. TaxID=1872529 RepID=UPI00286EF8AA|nr:LlaJI family restriction endonuclease [Anaerosporobacter sp.]